MTAREKAHEIIFQHHTPVGKAFDVGLILAIIMSVLVVMLDSVGPLSQRYGDVFLRLEWFFTIIFTFEYILRIWCANRRAEYALSFFGLVDLISIVPTYLSVIAPGTRFLAIIRVLRVLRVFRVLKLVRFIGEASSLSRALRASIRKIIVFVSVVLTVAVIVGSLMYVIEGPEAGFTSIPTGVYWAIVTLTTVGFGEIIPVTPLGKFLASALMILGYGIIAVPTGIVTVEMQRASESQNQRTCPACGAGRHADDARYCRSCAAKLSGDEENVS